MSLFNYYGVCLSSGQSERQVLRTSFWTELTSMCALGEATVRWRLSLKFGLLNWPNVKLLKFLFRCVLYLREKKRCKTFKQLDERNVSKFLFSCFLMSFRIEANPFMLDWTSLEASLSKTFSVAVDCEHANWCIWIFKE